MTTLCGIGASVINEDLFTREFVILPLVVHNDGIDRQKEETSYVHVHFFSQYIQKRRRRVQTRKLRKTFIITVICLLAATGPALTQESAPLKTDVSKKALIAELEKAIPDLMEKANVPGLSIAVIRKGKIIWSRGFGIKNTKTGEPVQNNTIFEAASLTKPFFAYTVLKLVESGELDLDTPLIKYAPRDYIEEKYIGHSIDLEGFRSDWFKRITARLVLSHSSGLPHGEPRNPLPIHFEPGAKYRYSADGYLYLQRIVEHLKGEPLHEVMRKMVIEPLKMKDSSMVWQEVYESQSAVGHNTFSDTRGEFRKRTKAHAGASLYTTAEDYARFVIAMMNNIGLKKQTVKEMLTPQIDVDENVFWGLGFGLEHTENGDGFWQWGDYGIFRNYVVAYKKEKIGVVYLTNSNNGLSFGQEIVNSTIGGEKDLGLLYLDYPHFDSPSKKFPRLIKLNGIEKALSYFHELKEKDPGALNEREINSLGYTLMNSGRLSEAISVLKLNVETYPESANSYDSLAEAYMKNGDYEQAIKFYKKAVEMTSEDKKADKAFLQRLKSGALKNIEKLRERIKRRLSKEEAETRYADFVGKWELDIEGYGLLVVKLFVEGGLLWGIVEGETIGDRLEFIPVGGKELAFKIDNPELGVIDWEFLRDDEEKITKCRFDLKDQGLKGVGNKK